MSLQEATGLLEDAKKIIQEGGFIEDALHLMREAAEKIGIQLLMKTGKAPEEGVSLTEIGYRLVEAGVLDQDRGELFSEISRMKEMAHYDIYAIYTREELIEKAERLKSIAQTI